MSSVLLETSLKGAAAWKESRVPFGKVKEADHFLWGVDISQGVVRVHQYEPPDDQTLKGEEFFFKYQQRRASVV